MRAKNIFAGIAGLVSAAGIAYEIAQISKEQKTYSNISKLESAVQEQKSPCDESLWRHIYHPGRLQVIERCKTVTGTIDHVKPEDDGDLHIRLRLDPGYENMLNEKNILKQHGCLVIEPVCVKEVIQPDAIDACVGFNNTVRIPKKGQHVRVTGAYVLDKQHGWNELHPITSMESIN